MAKKEVARGAVSKNFAGFLENHRCRSLILVKIQTYTFQLYQKKNSGTVVFLGVLQNSEEEVFCRAPA